MSARLRATFDSLHARGRAALIPFLMAGDPDLETSVALLDALPAAGADIIELGIPFSDPMADGPDIQAAGKRALDGGMTLRKLLDVASVFCDRHPAVPLVLMGYYNPILQFGLDAFAERAQEAGVDGVIVVDLPPEEHHVLHPLLHAKGIAYIRLVAPTTGEKRLEQLLADADGFVYTIAVKGITGSASPTADALLERIETIRKHTALPVVAGFGIKSASQVAELKDIVNGVVVGSALIRHIHSAKGEPIDAMRDFLGPLARALD